MSTSGLPVSDIVNVTITLEPTATATRNFGALLIIGSSGVLTASENVRQYASLDEVGEDFATTTPEYAAATVFFAQSPHPSTLYIGEQQETETDPTVTIARLAAATGDWYGCAFTEATMPTDTAMVTVAKQIEALNPPRTLWVTAQEAGAIDAASTTDLAYLLSKATVTRTFVQYSSSSPYAAISAFGRIATVDYTGSNTTLTLMFKTEPDVTAETLTSTQASALKAKNCNVYVNYQNGTAILQTGVMADGTWADTRIGADAFQNALQVAGFNTLYTQPKIAQTDAGMNILETTYDAQCSVYVQNGFFAPGVWDGPTIGALNSGDTMPSGYYIYRPAISTQSAADRAARKAVTMQIACKLAGAVHSSNVIVNIVN
ncbi:DUF3383 family protein [Acetobacter sicerae]|uniref:DUF3383 family protein n=1 Tax=Acetobacter sicerae TaxID=85325 RepID=UPI00156B3963|nr:DUF3383 family protein [Acetobacter sicerae]NHN93440.1 DUF3383 family protein [Acetobacter sicerae]